MKKNLLLFCTMMLSAVGAWAQSWVEPSLQYYNDAVPEKAAIYNVAQKQFLTKGGAWGTHAALGDAGKAFVYDIEAQQEDGVYKLHCSAAANTGYLGRNSTKDVYTDYKSGDWGLLWEFVKLESGNYNIKTAASDPVYGSNKAIFEGEYDPDADLGGRYLLGWSENEQDLTNGNGDPMGTNVGCYMFDMEDAANAGVSIEWCFVTADAFTLYDAQSALYNKLNEAFEMGYTEAELAAAASVLTGTDVEMLNAAVKDVEQLILEYGYNHATPDNPYDVSSVILNAALNGTKGQKPADWICTDNALIQNNKIYPDYDNTDANAFNNFVQDWTSSNNTSINAADIHQVIADLPQGTYRLTAYCIATSGSADLIPNGAELYAESGVIHYSTPVSMPNGAEGSGSPHLTTVEITHFGGDLTIGYGFTPGYTKWWGVDNFKLYYCGPVANPGLLALTSTYAAAQEYAENYEGEDAYFTAATYSALTSELKEADGIMAGADSEECQEEAAKLNALMNTIKAEMAAYEKLYTLVEKVKADVSAYETSVPSLGETLSGMLDQYLGAYEDREASVEDIESWIAGYNDVIVSGIKEAMSTASVEKPIEITALFPNMGYEENTAESAAPNGWTCEAGAFKARANTAEVWQASFNCYRILEGLPAGAYKLTAKALSRLGGSDENYLNYVPGENRQMSRLYLNTNEVPVADQAEGATPEQRYSNDMNVGTEDEPLWVPNSMEGARVYFNVEELYNNEVIGVSLEDGAPITIGIKHEGDVPGNSWTIWSDFHVYYMGVSNNALYDTMVALAEQARQKAGDSMTDEGEDKLNKAVDASERLNVTSSADDITAVINSLNDALAYDAATIPLFEKLMSMVSEMDGKVSSLDVESDYQGLSDMLDEAGVAVMDEHANSNEQIESWLSLLPIELTKFVQDPVLTTASEANPGDITPVLSNPDFTGVTKNNCPGWIFTYEADHIGPNNDAQAASNACEFWKAASFDMHQDIVGLAEGYYRLTMNGFYRAGNADPNIAAYTENPDSCRDMSLYANNASVLLKNILDDCSEEAIADAPEYVLGEKTVYAPNTMLQGAAFFEEGKYQNTLEFHLDKDQVLTLGLKLTGKVVDANWCMYDNFQLFYLGTTCPTAVESIASGTVSGNGQLYDLQGRKVAKAQKGLYIQNGKVVLVK